MELALMFNYVDSATTETKQKRKKLLAKTYRDNPKLNHQRGTENRPLCLSKPVQFLGIDSWAS